MSRRQFAWYLLRIDLKASNWDVDRHTRIYQNKTYDAMRVSSMSPEQRMVIEMLHTRKNYFGMFPPPKKDPACTTWALEVNGADWFRDILKQFGERYTRHHELKEMLCSLGCVWGDDDVSCPPYQQFRAAFLARVPGLDLEKLYRPVASRSVSLSASQFSQVPDEDTPDDDPLRTKFIERLKLQQSVAFQAERAARASALAAAGDAPLPVDHPDFQLSPPRASALGAAHSSASDPPGLSALSAALEQAEEEGVFTPSPVYVPRAKRRARVIEDLSGEEVPIHPRTVEDSPEERILRPSKKKLPDSFSQTQEVESFTPSSGASPRSARSTPPSPPLGQSSPIPSPSSLPRGPDLRLLRRSPMAPRGARLLLAPGSSGSPGLQSPVRLSGQLTRGLKRACAALDDLVMRQQPYSGGTPEIRSP